MVRHRHALFELQSEEGPCLGCYRGGQAVVNQDLATVNGRGARRPRGPSFR